MAAETKTAGIDRKVLADHESVMRSLTDGTPLDRELSRRVEERADRVIEELRQKHVQIDIDKLLRDARDES